MKPSQLEIDEAADLARDFGLVGLSVEGHRKLALLVAHVRAKRRAEQTVADPNPLPPRRVKSYVEPAKARPFPKEIVKGSGWSIR